MRLFKNISRRECQRGCSITICLTMHHKILHIEMCRSDDLARFFVFEIASCWFCITLRLSDLAHTSHSNTNRKLLKSSGWNLKAERKSFRHKQKATEIKQTNSKAERNEEAKFVAVTHYNLKVGNIFTLCPPSVSPYVYILL